MYRCIFIFVLFVALSIELTPVFALPLSALKPDLIYCFIAAWLLRRPDYVPTAAIVGIVVAAELMRLQTPGLWSAILLVLSEFLRAQAARFAKQSFWSEWLLISVTFAAATIFYLFALTLAFMPTPSSDHSLLHIASTVVAYPFAAGLTSIVFRVNKFRTADS